MSVMIKTGRFGQLAIEGDSKITIPQGIFGFPQSTEFCLVDPGDDTLILWLQSLENPDVVFPVLEPKIFKPDYRVRLSAAEQREMDLFDLSHAAVFTILTIPSDDITQMTSNLKAPLVINLKNQVAKQVVLQENEYSIQQPVFNELRAHLLTIQSNSGRTSDSGETSSSRAPEQAGGVSLVPVLDLPPSSAVQSLQQG